MNRTHVAVVKDDPHPSPQSKDLRFWNNFQAREKLAFLKIIVTGFFCLLVNARIKDTCEINFSGCADPLNHPPPFCFEKRC